MDSRDYIKLGDYCRLPKEVSAMCFKLKVTPEHLPQVSYEEVDQDVYSVCGWTFYATDDALREHAEVEARKVLRQRVPSELLPYFMLSQAVDDYLEEQVHADLVAKGRRTMYLYLDCDVGGWMVKNEE